MTEPQQLSADTNVAIGTWWAALSPEQQTTVLESIDEDDMRVGHVYRNLRELGLIRPLSAIADATGRKRIPWPDELLDVINRLAFPQP